MMGSFVFYVMLLLSHKIYGFLREDTKVSMLKIPLNWTPKSSMTSISVVVPYLGHLEEVMILRK